MNPLNRPSFLKREDFGLILLLCVLVFLYFYKILGLQYGFYSGDHRQQHYPWAFFYAQQLKQGLLPWWTSLFGCGFPLLAEGQVGALYPLNFIFYKFFPFDFAYTYNILFHYCLGAFFFYLWIRQQGIVAGAAFGGTLIYLFGTAQGGYYYNIISLKTLIWFPLALFWIHRIFIDRRYSALFPLALTFALQWTAGYLQYGVYAVLFTGITALIYAARAGFKQNALRHGFLGLGCALLAVILSVAVAWPQLGATFELSQFSNRFNFPVEFAFVGSMNPLSIAALFFPHWDGFLGAEFYVGAVGLFFLILAFSGRRSFSFLFFAAGLVLALLLALGKWNPIFKLLVETTQFSGFRVSKKFLYFAGTYGAALCALGMHHWLARADIKSEKRAAMGWLFLQGAAIAGMGICGAVFHFFDRQIFAWGKSYLETHFQQSVIHPHPMETYLFKLRQFMDFIGASLTWRDSWNLGFIIFMFISAVGYFLILRFLPSRKKGFILLLALLFANLWFYGNTSIRGSIVARSFLNADSKVIDFLGKQKGRAHRVVHEMPASVDMEIVPHNSMLKRVSLLGGYSPLIMMKYYQWMEEPGDINDSNIQKLFKPENEALAHTKLNLMNAEWLVSDKEIAWHGVKAVMAENNQFVYQNEAALPRVYFVSDIAGVDPAMAFAGAEKVSFADFADTQNRVLFSAQTNRPGYLVLSDLDYPGWKARINGQAAQIEPFLGLFRAVKIPQGSFEFMTEYLPVWRSFLPWSAGLFILCFVLSLKMRAFS